MAVNFPLTIREFKEMHEDGDLISLILSYVCLGFLVLFILSLGAYYLLSGGIFRFFAVVCFSASAVSLFGYYWHRPKFLLRFEEKINSLYENICGKIDDFQFKRETYTGNPNIPFPIYIEKLYEWFPRENKCYLKACWKRLQEEKRIYWDRGMWVIRRVK